jgi:hypothetical protein
MHTATLMLIQWKVVYDALRAAQASLKEAVDTGSPEEEIKQLREEVQRLQFTGDIVLEELNARLASLRPPQKVH